jgi:membrane protein required for colicin V production
MNWVDYVIISIIAISILIGLLRGFTREALSLTGWVLAVWVTVTFADEFERFLRPFIASPSGRLVVAIAVLFMFTIVVAALVNHLATELIKKSGLSGTDRVIGVAFGFARGCAIVVVLVLLGGLTPMPQDGWWRQSHLLHYFEDMALWLRSYLPPEVASSIRYS